MSLLNPQNNLAHNPMHSPVIPATSPIGSTPDNLLSRIHEESVALAMKLITPDKLGQPYATPVDPKIGSFAHHIASGTTFRILCNCASALPKNHTQRHVGAHYTEHRYPTEDEIRESLRPRVVPPAVQHFTG